MNTLFGKHKWLQIIYGALLLAAAIIITILAFTQKEEVSKWLSVILAIGLFIFASCAIFAGIFTLQKGIFSTLFIYGIVAIALDVVLCAKTDLIETFLVIFVGALLLAIGAVECGEAAAMIYFKRGIFKIALFFAIGAAFITLGVLALVFQTKTTEIIYVALGIIIALLGIFETIMGIRYTIQMKKAQKEIDDLVVENQVEDVPPQKEPENLN